ncbi:MAG: NAD(P)-dependent oxidoreductase [Isosphaeraceae bacterium]
MTETKTGESRLHSIGIIGLGLVGTAISRRLIAAGYTLTGYDPVEQARNQFQSMGGRPLANVGAVARSASVIILSLPDGKVVKNVTESCAGAFQPGAVVIDTTTASPHEVLACQKLLALSEIEYLDATISGSSEVIAQGQATWMVGGSEIAFQKIKQLLETIGGVIHHTGPTGSGTQMKLISNLILGLNRAVLAEGLALAEFWGMNLPATLEVLKSTAAYSKVMDAKGEKMIGRDYSPQARLRQHHKDVSLMLEAVKASKLKLYLSELHDDLLNEAEAAGLGELDNSAIFEVWQKKCDQKPEK